jgi:hypothetical protein
MVRTVTVAFQDYKNAGTQSAEIKVFISNFDDDSSDSDYGGI